MDDRDYLGMLVLMLIAVGMAQGKLVDIRREVSNIITQHNHERMDSQLLASDMLEMRWDEELARRAGEYAERCRYRRPHIQDYEVGSNLYFETDFIHGAKSVHHFVNRAFRAWTMPKRMFTFSAHCGSACSYVQMITASTNQVGCAVSTCTNLENGNFRESTNLLDSLPYKTGLSCSQCPTRTTCHNGLCVTPGVEAVPYYLRETYFHKPHGNPHRESPPHADVLSAAEKHYLTSGHNRMRETNSKDPLEWDSYLERWANWIVNCAADYPGPAHTYTNFERLDQGDQVYNKISDWSTEGEVTNIQLIHGCRTAFDNTRCNHYTNVRQPMLTSMACATKDCRDGTRQLVCIYDNKVDRVYRSSGYTYDRRENRRYDRNRRSLRR